MNDDADEAIVSIALDGNGNIFVTGSFQGTVDFDPGLGSSLQTSEGE